MELFLKYHREYPPEALGEEDYRKLMKLEENDILRCKVWKERNVNFHKKYFALMNCSIYHLPEHVDDEFRNLDNFRYYVTILTGRYDLVPSLKGHPIPKAHSISFEKMDNDEFQSLYSDSINVILKHFLKDISQDDFEQDLLNFI